MANKPWTGRMCRLNYHCSLGKGLCCADCTRRGKCRAFCQNTPERCGQVDATPPPDPRKALRQERAARFQALYDEGLSDGAIANQVGVTSSTVCNWRHSEGLPPNYKPGGGSHE